MKRRALIAGTIALSLEIATVSSGAELSLRWQNNPSQPTTFAAPFEAILIDVVLSLQPGEEFAGVGFGFEPVPDVDLVDVSTDIPNWSTSPTTLGPLDFLDTHIVGLAAEGTGQHNLIGPLDTTLGTVSLETDNPTLPETELAFSFPDTLEESGVPIFLPFLDENGNDFLWDARFNNTSTFPGYVAFGDWGSPGWQLLNNKSGEVIPGGGQARNPLILNVPEPATLLLLLLGLATIQRAR